MSLPTAYWDYMLDLVYVLLTIAFFVIALTYADACDRGLPLDAASRAPGQAGAA